jgi:uncharacterized protein (DUF305 family)
MKRSKMLAAAAAFVVLGGAAVAQHSGHGSHSGHGAPAKPAASGNAVAKAFQDVNDKMHRDMNIPFTGDADADFARGMIPHHQGAVDMARIVLQHGKDPEIRKLAEEVVKTQEAEIRMMREWLARRGK